jgi:hypothetical protein
MLPLLVFSLAMGNRRQVVKATHSQQCRGCCPHPHPLVVHVDVVPDLHPWPVVTRHNSKQPADAVSWLLSSMPPLGFVCWQCVWFASMARGDTPQQQQKRQHARCHGCCLKHHCLGLYVGCVACSYPWHVTCHNSNSRPADAVTWLLFLIPTL